MLGRLITPLRAAFDIPQRVETTHANISNVDEDAESFARDVRIELMRNSIEAFKNADDLRAKIEVSRSIKISCLKGPPWQKSEHWNCISGSYSSATACECLG